jgi:hypothetical protein
MKIVPPKMGSSNEVRITPKRVKGVGVRSALRAGTAKYAAYDRLLKDGKLD